MYELWESLRRRRALEGNWEEKERDDERGEREMWVLMGLFFFFFLCDDSSSLFYLVVRENDFGYDGDLYIIIYIFSQGGFCLFVFFDFFLIFLLLYPNFPFSKYYSCMSGAWWALRLDLWVGFLFVFIVIFIFFFYFHISF